MLPLAVLIDHLNTEARKRRRVARKNEIGKIAIADRDKSGRLIGQLRKKVEFLCRDAENACVECGWEGHDARCSIGRLLAKARA